MATFLLQANPDLYNLDAALRLHRGTLDWSLNQHAAKVTPGDTVYLWRASGKAKRVSGIVARAKVDRRLSPDEPGADVQFHINTYEVGNAPRIALRDLDILPAGQAVPRELLRGDARTREMTILRAPFQTVFTVDEPTALHIQALFEQVMATWSTAAMAVLPNEGDAAWYEAADRARDTALLSPDWWARTEQIVANRVSSQKRELVELDRFLTGEIGLSEYRTGFDERSRDKDHAFGFGGPSGAMVLNQLDLHADPDATARMLREVLEAPTTQADALERASHLVAFFEQQRQKHGLAATKLSSGRAVTLLSYLWHVQQPKRWPAWYGRVRDELESWALLAPSPERSPAQYIEYCAAFAAVVHRYGEHPWFVARILSDHPEPTPTPVAEPIQRDEPRNVWLYAPGAGAEHWDEFYSDGIAAIGWDELGDMTQFESFDDVVTALVDVYQLNGRPTHNAHTCWNFVRGMAEGDTIYVKRGRYAVIGRGVVTSAARFEPDRDKFRMVRDVLWEWRGDEQPRDRALVTKTLTRISHYPLLLSQLASATGLVGSEPEAAGDADRNVDTYGIDDAMNGLFLPRASFADILELLRRKKNLVLQGPPGTGKTFIAERLAYALMGENAPERVTRVQFHQSMAYEDFVQGYRPKPGGSGDASFALQSGAFMHLCDTALQSPDDLFVLLIDEINRGNLSRIFGELLMLLEADKRDPRWGLTLTYEPNRDVRFHVPPNVYVIGTMNTADRSLALVDYALRRRFAFVPLKPAFGQDAFRTFLAARVGDGTAKRWCTAFEVLNARIRSDASLGAGFEIGHSYLCGAPSGEEAESWFDAVLKYEIRPLLEEYWYDSPSLAREALIALGASEE